MKLPAKAIEISRMLSPTAWLVAALAVVGALVLAWWLVTEPGRQAQKAAEAKATAQISAAQAGAGRDAVAIQDQALGDVTQTQSLTRESADVIHAAPGADVRLDPQLNRTARQRVCLREAYSHLPECVQPAGRAHP